MSWYDPRDWNIGDKLKKIGLNGPSASDERKMSHLNDVGADAHYVGNQAADNYLGMTGRLNGALDDLQGQAQGRNLVSSEMLRQGMQQGVAAQRSLAASASPANSAMAARSAAMQMGRLGYGLSGQQALAGMQERNQAQQAYANLINQSRGQDLQGALGGYNAATGAYGGGLNGQRDPTLAGQWSNAIQAGASIFSKGGKPPGGG